MNITFHAPQIICVGLSIFSLTALAFTLTLRDFAEKITHNVFASIVAILIAFPLLFWGGFFDTWGIPQGIYTTVWVLSFFRELVLHGQKQDVNMYQVVIGTLYTYGLLIWGGFFSQ